MLTFVLYALYNMLVIDRISGEAKTVRRVRPSARPFVSTRGLYHFNQLIFGLGFLRVYRYNHSSPGIENKVNSQMQKCVFYTSI